MKNPKQLERYFKGVSNHRRITILFLVAKNKGITLEEITDKLNWNIKTVSEHTRRLVNAGLLRKNYQGRFMSHSLSPYGEKFIEFMKSFE